MKLFIRLLLVGVSLFIALIAVMVLVGLPEESAPLAEATAVNQPVVDGRVTVEVLNAGGVSGVARAATATLRSAGFDVVSFGNASSFDQVESVVVDRIGDPNRALSVASVLGIRNVRSEPDSNLYLDISVLLGSQWVLPKDSTQAEETGTVWWDPWSWLHR
ncbi:MAG: LytR C-terminal domain-containing protein [Gemmatimonadota bacterium]|nr:LytR C-terminal domain-containing protein [Gemmatimonadota bacterium]